METGQNMTTSSSVAETVWKEIESTRSVNDDQLCILHFLFGKNFERATRIVDQRGVKRISGERSGRSIFQILDNASEFSKTKTSTLPNCPYNIRCMLGNVIGESKRKEEYLCFAESFCACYSFFYDIVNRGEQLCCKHQLAARLAASLGVCVDVKVSDEDLALLLVSI